MQVDYLIVGAGLTGAVIARTLADAGREVLILDRRAHVGGNVHDHCHPSGIRIHTYGPHYFRTSSARIWEFATRFSPFYKFEGIIKSFVDQEFANWPVSGEYIHRTVGKDWKPDFSGTPANFEEAALSLMPRVIYEKFVKGYSEKQWGVPASQLAAKLCTRFEIHHDNDPRLKPLSRYQGIPECGYAEWTARMIAGIPVILNYDYLTRRNDIQARKMLVFTGPVDEFFGFDLGKLVYRGQRRVHTYLAGTDCAQPCGQVNYPLHEQGALVRRLEWKHMMQPELARRISGTVITDEIPYSPEKPEEYEYPFPDMANATLYQQYRQKADALTNTLICGRLGEYRYYDMDQAIGRAIELANGILGREQTPDAGYRVAI